MITDARFHLFLEEESENERTVDSLTPFTVEIMKSIDCTYDNGKNRIAAASVPDIPYGLSPRERLTRLSSCLNFNQVQMVRNPPMALRSHPWRRQVRAAGALLAYVHRQHLLPANISSSEPDAAPDLDVAPAAVHLNALQISNVCLALMLPPLG